MYSAKCRLAKVAVEMLMLRRVLMGWRSSQLSASPLTLRSPLASQLRAAGARFVAVSGRWPVDPTLWQAAGVTHVLHRDLDLRSVLHELHDAAGGQP